MTIRIKLARCEASLLREIADEHSTRRLVAQTYAVAMRSGEEVDWPRVNAAIIERWSVNGLDWIKRQAHSGRCFE